MKRAVLEVMRLAGKPLRTRNVADLASDLVGRVLSESTVSNCLAKRCNGEDPVFEQIRPGHFALMK